MYPKSTEECYRRLVRERMEGKLVILIDDSDVLKSEGYKLEALGHMREGSESTDKKSVYKRGYYIVTEAVAITRSKQPVSLFREFILQRKRAISPRM